MIIKRTYLQKKKYTKEHGDHRCMHCHSKAFKNVRTYRGLDVDSEHFMVRAKLEQQLVELRNQNKQNREQHSQANEKKITCENNLSRVLTSISSNINEIRNVEKVWTEIKGNI